MAGRRRISWLWGLWEILRSAQNDDVEFPDGDLLVGTNTVINHHRCVELLCEFLLKNNRFAHPLKHILACDKRENDKRQYYCSGDHGEHTMIQARDLRLLIVQFTHYALQEV
jgi:hypothetical protein